MVFNANVLTSAKNSTEKYGELERMLRNQESIKNETKIDKMNSLLDTVQQLQTANESFRKQLKDAGIEPDPTPAVTYHSHHLLVDENDDLTVLEKNELIKEKSLITNQKIAHLSSEINVRPWFSKLASRKSADVTAQC